MKLEINIDIPNYLVLELEEDYDFGANYYQLEESIVYLVTPKCYIVPDIPGYTKNDYIEYIKNVLSNEWITVIDNIRVHVIQMYNVNYDKIKDLYSKFGSFIDYLPIVRDDDFNMILMNCNPDSPNYQKVVLKSNDINNNTIYCTSKYNLSELLIKKRNMETNYKHTGDVETDFYNMPIKKLMEDEGFATHFNSKNCSST